MTYLNHAESFVQNPRIYILKLVVISNPNPKPIPYKTKYLK